MFGPNAFPDDEEDYKITFEDDDDAKSEYHFNDKKLKMGKQKITKMKSMQDQDFDMDEAPDLTEVEKWSEVKLKDGSIYNG